MFTVLEERKKKENYKLHWANATRPIPLKMKIITHYLSFLLTEFHNAITMENVLKQFFQVIQLSDKSV